MITFKASFTDNGGKGKIDKAAESALEALSIRIATDSNKYIPKDYGPLESSVFSDSDFSAGLIIWGMEYAARLYYDRSMKLNKDKNPLASHLWFEVAKGYYMTDWLEYGQQVYKQNL